MKLRSNAEMLYVLDDYQRVWLTHTTLGTTIQIGGYADHIHAVRGSSSVTSLSVGLCFVLIDGRSVSRARVAENDK